MVSPRSHACPFSLFRELFPNESLKINLLSKSPCRFGCSVQIGNKIYNGYGQTKQQAKHEMGLDVLISLFPSCAPLIDLSIFKRFSNCEDYPSKYRELLKERGDDETLTNYDERYLSQLKKKIKFHQRILALTSNYFKKTPLQMFNEICDVARNVISVEITYDDHPTEVPEFNSAKCVCCKVVWNGRLVRGFGINQKYAKMDAAQKALVKLFNVDPNVVISMISNTLRQEITGLPPKEALIKLCSLRAIKFRLKYNGGLDPNVGTAKLVCGLDTFETTGTKEFAITSLWKLKECELDGPWQQDVLLHSLLRILLNGTMSSCSFLDVVEASEICRNERGNRNLSTNVYG
ncbi:RNA exonuclease [Trichinella spiralis]|uniref:RNA exonuclease n=1 Tax=Trichinella spiralis TaxID=6334 RepID=A0ABR3KJK3_TRISP